jgi:hypothetical protein
MRRSILILLLLLFAAPALAVDGVLEINQACAAYHGNVVSGNTGGTVSGGTARNANYCDGVNAPTCP